MFIFILPLMFAVIIFTTLATGMQSTGAVESKNARNEIISYRIFVQTADAFVKANTPPAATTSYNWAAIKSAAAPGQRAAEMKSDWRVVWSNDGSWAACTVLSEMATAQINEMYAATVAPAQGASATGLMAGNRLLPASIPGGGGGRLQLDNASGPYSGLVALGTPEQAKASAGLCNQ